MSEACADVVELKLLPDAKYIAVVRLTAAAVASRAGMTVDDVDDLKVAVSEVFTNVIDHAFEGRELRPVVIRMSPRPTGLAVEIIDEGVGFDVGSRDFNAEADLTQEGGLGLYLVHRYMDEVSIESAPGSGTKVTMLKRLAR